MTLAESGGGLSPEHEALIRELLPNLPDDVELISLWREFKWGGDWGDFYEFTLYYKETERLNPRYYGTRKMRVDFNVDFDSVQSDDILIEDVRITYWGDVERYGYK